MNTSSPEEWSLAHKGMRKLLWQPWTNKKKKMKSNTEKQHRYIRSKFMDNFDINVQEAPFTTCTLFTTFTEKGYFH